MAQNSKQYANEKLRVFLDCGRCYETYIRDEVKFVNFVRDREDAQVHLLITRAGTGAGIEYTLRLIGKGGFDGRGQTLSYVSFNSDTDDEERKGLLRYTRTILFPYVTKTKVVDEIEITYKPTGTSNDVKRADPWNSWLFEINGRTSMDGEESRKSFYFNGGVSANRTTERMKTNLRYDHDFNKRTFTIEDSNGVEEESIYITRSHRFSADQVFSITDHWSAGVFTEVRNSTRNNYDLTVMGSAGLEYNVFPYNEYAEREISFVYLVGTEFRDYSETTIFLKDRETLLEQQLRARIDFTKPWGGISGRANYRTFLHDLQKNRFYLNMNLNFRVFRGLELSLSGRYSIINNQLNIPASDVSNAEQLLNLREQFTSYSYGAFIGLEYTFGSIFNQVVNPRF